MIIHAEGSTRTSGAKVGAARAWGLAVGMVSDAVWGHRKVARKPPVGARPAPPWLGDVALLAGTALDRIGRRSGLLRCAGTALATWGALGGAELADRGTILVRELETGDLDAVRDTLAPIDPRGTGSLNQIALTRAAIEAIAENTSETVIGPLAWGALAGTPGLLLHRGLKKARDRVPLRGNRRALGVAAHRADEFMDLLPTRCTAALTVAAAPVVGGSAKGAWVAWRRDAAAHPSPNAGRVEAAFAGALEIRLGGRTVYPDRVQELPVLGAGRNPDTGHVTRAVELSRLVAWFGGLGAVMLATAFERRPGGRWLRPPPGSRRPTAAASHPSRSAAPAAR